MVVDGCVMLVAERNFACQTSSRLETSEVVLCPPSLVTTENQCAGLQNERIFFWASKMRICVVAVTAEEAQFRSRCANDITFRIAAQEHDRQAWEVVARTVVVSSKRFELMKVQRVRRKSTACSATSKRPCFGRASKSRSGRRCGSTLLT